MDNKYGEQCSSDNAFTRKARLLQSMYRVEIGEEEGVGPTRCSQHHYGNMISGGEVSGKNFLLRETFEYAKERVRNKKDTEMIDEFRLFNNLLSSMPMAFNLFHPLMLLLKHDPAMVTLAVRSVFKNLPVFEVTEIGLEFIPSPIEKYTKDRSAMDAYIKFLDNKGGRHLIAVETKYTDELGVNEASHCEEQKQMLIDTRLFDSEFEELLLDGKVKLTQVYRNFLLTERYRIVEGLKDSFSVVLSPKDHPSTGEEIKSVARYLKPEYAYKLRAVTLEDCKHPIKYTLYSPPLFRYFANKKAMKRIMSKEEFLSVYERQQASGLTIKDFCENEAYSSSCFHYWKKKFGLSRTYTSHPDKLPDDTFIPLELCRRGNLPSGAGGNVTIELPSGIRIHFDSSGNPELTFGLIHKLCGHVLSE